MKKFHNVKSFYIFQEAALEGFNLCLSKTNEHPLRPVDTKTLEPLNEIYYYAKLFSVIVISDNLSVINITYVLYVRVLNMRNLIVFLLLTNFNRIKRLLCNN